MPLAWTAKWSSGSIEKYSTVPPRLLVDCVPIAPEPCDTRTVPMFSELIARLTCSPLWLPYCMSPSGMPSRLNPSWLWLKLRMVTRVDHS